MASPPRSGPPTSTQAAKLGARVETGTVFANRCDYLDPALVWTGVKDTGKGGGLSEIGYANLTQPKSYHLAAGLAPTRSRPRPPTGVIPAKAGTSV